MRLPFKNYYNFTLDLLLLHLFFAVAISSYVLWFLLPMGLGRYGASGCRERLTGEGWDGNQWFVFELPRFMWIEIHSWIGILATVLLVLHLLFHWRWVIETTVKFKECIKKGQKAIVERYVVSFVVLLTLASFQLLSGCVIWLIMPQGDGDFLNMKGGLGRTFWGLQRNEWGDIHAWVAVVMIAVAIIHLIIHWRWIVNMILGKIYSGKAHNKSKTIDINAVDYPLANNGLVQPNYLFRTGLYTGLIGCMGFLVLIGIYQLDWVGRYNHMFYLIPLPFICLLLAHKWNYSGGISLIAIGIAAIMVDTSLTMGVISRVVGLDANYVVFFITLPLVVSGCLFVLAGRKKSKLCI